MVALLSKIDANLLQFQETKKEVIDLYLPDPTNNGIQYPDDTVQPLEQGISMNDSAYSGSIETLSKDIISYHVSPSFNCLSLYQLASNQVLKTVNIHFYTTLLNKQHTLSLLSQDDSTLMINMILEDGVFISIKLPLNVFDPIVKRNNIDLGNDWFTAHAPYDFSVRVPHLLHSVTPEFSMVFFADGGLLGLKTLHDKSFEPILFNDGSYLQSLFGVFKKSKSHGKVVSCVSFQDKYLITVTEYAYLRIWDLTTFSLLQNTCLLPSGFETVNKTYDIIGNYLTIYHNFMAIYTPFENGKFQIGSLSMNNNGVLQFNIQSIISSSLSSSSIWFLADMKLNRPLDLNLPQSFINLVILWKSGDASKLQLLNIANESLNDYQWVESSNKSINDIDSSYDLILENNIVNQNEYDRLLFALKSRYSEDIFERAQTILSENNIVIKQNDGDFDTNLKSNLEYLGNLETILRDLKKQCGDVSTLSLFKDELIVVNSLKKFNHYVYKVNTSIETYFYNISDSIGNDDHDLVKFLKSLHTFTSSISDETLLACGNNFIGIITGEISKDLSLPEKFSEIFKNTLQSQFDINQLQQLFNELNTIDVVSCMNDFIDNHILAPNNRGNFIETLTHTTLGKILSVESLYQRISIEHKFVLKVLLVFVLLDSNYSIFEKQLTTLLELFYKQSLFLNLRQQNDYLLIDEVFKKTSKLGHGSKLNSYLEWNGYIQHAVQQIYSLPIESNDYLWKFFEQYVVVSPLNRSQQELRAFATTLGSLFYIRGKKLQEFLQAMLLFVCGDYEASFELFQLHNDYTDMPRESLPYFLNNIIDDKYGNNVWSNLIKCFISKDNKLARYNYHISCLFETYANDNKLALMAIQKSLEISMRDQINDIKDFDIATIQHQQLLNLLLFFSMYEEVIDILRLSHFCLPEEERTRYFEKLLGYTNHNTVFFSTLLNLCKANNLDQDGEKFLSHEDYHIIDSILYSNLGVTKDWKDYKRLYSFRLLNGNDREAAEIMYEYYVKHGIYQDIETRKQCYLIIMNILSTFETVYDQWLVNGDKIVSLQDLKDDFKRL